MIKNISIFLLLFSVCFGGNPEKEAFIKKWKNSEFNEGETMLICDFFSAGEKKEYNVNSKDSAYILLTIDNSAIRKTNGAVTCKSIDFQEYNFSTSYGGGRKLPAKDGIIRVLVSNESLVSSYIIISYK